MGDTVDAELPQAEPVEQPVADPLVSAGWWGGCYEGCCRHGHGSWVLAGWPADAYPASACFPRLSHPIATLLTRVPLPSYSPHALAQEYLREDLGQMLVLMMGGKLPKKVRPFFAANGCAAAQSPALKGWQTA